MCHLLSTTGMKSSRFLFDSQREFGYAELQVVDRFGKNDPNDHVSSATSLFSDVPTGSQLWMSHGDKVTKMAPGFEVLGSTDNCEYILCKNYDVPSQLQSKWAFCYTKSRELLGLTRD